MKSQKSDSENRYPVKLRISFNRQNSTIQLYDKGYTKDEFNKLISQYGTLPSYDNEIRRIKKIIRYEYGLVGERHTLKGFSSRYSGLYLMPLNIVINPIGNILKNSSIPDNLRRTFNGEFFYRQGENINILQLYDICKILDSEIKEKVQNPDSLMTFYLMTMFYDNFHGKINDKINVISVFDWIDEYREDYIEKLDRLSYQYPSLDSYTRKSYFMEDIKFSIDKIGSYVSIIDLIVDLKIEALIKKNMD